MLNRKEIMILTSIILGLYFIAIVDCNGSSDEDNEYEFDELGFDMDEGRTLVKSILDTISGYLGVGLDYSSINAATDVDDLTSAANNLLTDEQDNKLVNLKTSKRKDLRNKIQKFITEFRKLLKDSDDGGNSRSPLQYLVTRINNSLK